MFSAEGPQFSLSPLASSRRGPVVRRCVNTRFGRRELRENAGGRQVMGRWLALIGRDARGGSKLNPIRRETRHRT